MSLKFKKIIFRLLGILLTLGALFSFYYFGQQLFPLFAAGVGGELDLYQIFFTLTALLFGAPAGLLVGVRLSVLRSFSSTALIFFSFLPAAFFFEVVHPGTIAEMDRALSMGVWYVVIYGVMLFVFYGMRKYWYASLSHEKERHVGIETADGESQEWPRAFLILALLIALLFFHPESIGVTIGMLFSPVTVFISFFM